MEKILKSIQFTFKIPVYTLFNLQLYSVYNLLSSACVIVSRLTLIINLCAPPLQDGLVWYRGGIWSREEDQPTQCPVSHCQHRRPSGSHPQDQVQTDPKNMISSSHGSLSPCIVV